jgi:thiol-disulfide isomerase/thioredoxin
MLPLLFRRGLLLVGAGVSSLIYAQEPEATDRIHALKLTVLDAETSRPVAGAEAAYVLLRDPVKAVTEADGRVELKIPTGVPGASEKLRFDVTVRARGYGTRQIGWFASAGRVLATLPAGREVRLVRGVTAGGVVQDAKGHPVAGVKIELYGSNLTGGRLGGNNRSVSDAPCVALFGPEAPVTDENGRWQLEDFPSDLNQAALTVTRPGGAKAFFMAGEAPDLSWQRGQRVDLGLLKSGGATLVLQEGFTVAGRVVDEAGRPLTGVTLRARDADSRNAAHEFTTDFEGRFELRNWDATRVLVSAERVGYQGTTVTVPAGVDAPPATIMLKPARPFRLRVLDGDGKPVADAVITADPNPGPQIFSWRTKTDAEGRAVWPTAPDQPVRYWINAGPQRSRTATYPADGTEHEVRFRPGDDRSINVNLRVIDAASGAALPGAEIWRRMSNDREPKPWGEADRHGGFTREIRRDEFTKGIVTGYRLEVRAPGYGSWGSPSLDFSNGDQEHTIKLVPGGPSNVPPPNRQMGTGQNGDTNPALLHLATKVARLLESGDVAAFVEQVAATTADWQSIMPEGIDPAKAPNTRDNGRVLERYKNAISASANKLLVMAGQAGLAPGTVRFDVKTVTSPGNGRTIFRIDGREVSAPRVDSITIVLAGEPAAGAPAKLRGDYQLSVGSSHQFATGWKTEQGVRWMALPEGLASEAMKFELQLVNRLTGEMRGDSRSISATDDPALGEFSTTLVTLLKTGDVAAFLAAAGPARMGVAGKDLEKYELALADALRGLLDYPARLGADFAGSTIEVQQVIAGSVRSQEFGSVSSLSAGSLRVVINLEGAGPGAGRYAVEFTSGARRDGRWVLANSKVRWQQIPENLLAAGDKQAIALENYVAEHRSLPPGHAAPEIELVRLTDDIRVPLSSYQGKFVILEFWATWCGPCQEPMAKLQQLFQEHPEWKDRVEILTVSIDSRAAKAADHLQSKGWNKTTNFWAGAGEFKSPPALAYRVNGIPASYVIGPDGKILAGGHPALMDFATLIGTVSK